MKINTKYNTGDKVWYYIPNLNQYAWGKIESMDISIRLGKVDVTRYYIENRFYDSNYRLFSAYDYSGHKSDLYISLLEHEVYLSLEDLKHDLEIKHKDKMSRLTELKKGIFK